MKQFLCFISLCISFHVSAQLPEVLHEKRDAISKLLQISESYWPESPAQAHAIANDALSLAKMSEDNAAAMQALSMLGNMYMAEGNFAKAQDHFHEALKIARKGNDKFLLRESFVALGDVFFKTGNYRNALFYHFEALKIAESIESLNLKSESYYYIGKIHAKLKDYDKALNFLQRSNNDGDDFSMKGRPAIFTEIANIQLDRNKIDLSKSYFNQAVQLSKRLDNAEMLAQSYLGLGKLYLKIMKLSIAEEYFQLATSIQQSRGDKYGMAMSLYFLAKTNFVQTEYDNAIALLDESFAMASTMQSKELLMLNHELYSQIYYQSKDFKKAHFAQQEAFKIKEFLYNLTLGKALSDLHVKYEIDQRQVLLAKKNEELAENKIYAGILISLASLTTILVILIFGRSRQKRRYREKLEVRQKEIFYQKRKLERKTLFLERLFEKLKKVKAQIEEQNANLVNAKEKLEFNVRERTQELEFNNQNLDKANKELDTFIYKTSHDIRGPLARLQGLCNIAILDVDDARGLDYFNRLSDTAATLDSTLNQLLIMSQVKRAKTTFKKVNLHLLHKNVLEELCDQFDLKHLKFDIRISEELNIFSDGLILNTLVSTLLKSTALLSKSFSQDDLFIAVTATTVHDNLVINFVDNFSAVAHVQSVELNSLKTIQQMNSEQLSLGLYIVKICVEKLKGKFYLIKNEKAYAHYRIELPVIADYDLLYRLKP